LSRQIRLNLAVVLAGGLLLGPAGISSPARADSTGRQIGNFLSGTGNLIYLGAGVALPLLEDGKQGAQHTLRIVDATLTSELFTEGLKYAVRERRPDSTAHDSFPSGHATAAFAVATTESHFHPRQALLWYGGATLISASRVTLHHHFIHDVLAGAGIGYLTARWELSQRRGLILAPVIEPSSRTFGLLVTRGF
jgi:membrane-associated phospholipid phosphatase